MTMYMKLPRTFFLRGNHRRVKEDRRYRVYRFYRVYRVYRVYILQKPRLSPTGKKRKD